jgi:F-type H+-transporting ATPase subunit a
MYDPEQQLIAQNDHPPQEHTGGGTTDKHGTTDQHGTDQKSGGQHGTTDQHGEQKEGGGDNFGKMLTSLSDHREVSFGHVHLFDLPVILIDDGLHVYASTESMQAAGRYEYTHHHIYRKGTEQPPAFDMSVTSLIFFQWLAMALLMIVLIPMARKYKRNGVKPLKGFHNAVEAVIVYVRDEIVVPNVGEGGKKLLPIFLTFFFFILTMNLVGLVPGGHTSTGSINVTAGLAIIAFFVIQLASIANVGLGNWLKHLTGGVHWALWPIMIPVEVLGLFTKPFALAVRLFANMTAGHVILLSLISLIFIGGAFIPVSIGFSLFIYLLELLVAFLQAYIFTTLTAVFTGMGMASHGHDDHGHEQHPEGLSEHAAAH